MDKKLYHSKAWLKLQRSKGKTIADIAKDCGVSYQMIDVYLKKFGLK
jgi:Zn-dependent peptidase ImmA (M78 family)